MPKVKKIGIVLLVLFVLFLLALAALPLWLPWAGGPVLNRLGIAYDSYERVGYGRFALREVDYSNDRVQARAGRVEAFTPMNWLWHRWRASEDVEYVTVDDWRVKIEEVEEPVAPPEVEEPEEAISVFEIFEGLEEVMPVAIDWVPRAWVGSGELTVGDRIVDVRGATWREGLFAAEVFDRTLEQSVHFEGDVTEGIPYSFRGRTDPFPLTIETIIARAEQGLVVRSEINLAGNRLVADAEFPREGFWPGHAILRSDDFRLPPEYFELEGYQNVLGSFLFEWREGRFIAGLEGRAEPVEEQAERLPPLRVDASARGDLESFLVESLEIRSPWLVATLSDPVAMDYGGELLTEVSVFQLAADLSEQPFVDAAGRVRGEVRISPGDERLPFVTFSLTGENLAGYEVELNRIELNGSLQWPELALENLLVEGPEESRATASGKLNLDTMEIAEGRAAGEVRPEVVARWLPEDSCFSAVHLDGTFEGPVAELRHGGRIEAEDLVFPGTQPMHAQFDWEGRMENLSDFSLEAVAGAGRLTVDGSSEFGPERFGLFFRQVRLERDTEPILESVAESRLLVEWAEEPLLFSLDQFHWTGDGLEVKAEAAVRWPRQGRFSASARGMTTDLFTDFLDVEAGFITLSSAEIEGAWEEGPLDFRAMGEVRMALGAADEVLFEVDARGEREEMQIERLRATSRGEALVLAEGTLPVAIWPGREHVLHVRGEGEIDFRAHTDPEARFWREVGDLTGIHLDDPRLSLEITGTPYAPTGYIRGSSPRIHLVALENADQPVPVLEDLRIETTFDVDQIRLQEISIQVEGQRVAVEGGLPMGSRQWRTLVQDRELPDWERASGRVRILEAKMAAFTRFAPGVLSPQGTVRADVEILPGWLFDGEIFLEDAATRPLMPFGSIREGTAKVVLRGRTAHLEEISAVIGGERLTVTGRVDLPLAQELAFDVNIRGRNLPLTRQPGVVIRGDLDLLARSEAGEVPVISGRVDLRDSFYLAHLRLMPTGAVAAPARRPPFFSIEEEPFNRWRLNVDLRGPGFLSVRGPIFQGDISANFNLSGTLEEPRAIGTATIDAGRVRFPFAGMSVEQGEIALRREDPFQPQLFIVATGMSFGYDLRMEITGTAETPVIEFTANPPLTSEQALLMVTTGELPREEIRFTTQQRASRFAIYFGQNLLYELTGDDAAGDRLTIRSGEQVSEGGRETLSIEFKLADRWSVVGEHDRFDEYNVGLKWNIFSR